MNKLLFGLFDQANDGAGDTGVGSGDAGQSGGSGAGEAGQGSGPGSDGAEGEGADSGSPDGGDIYLDHLDQKPDGDEDKTGTGEDKAGAGDDKAGTGERTAQTPPVDNDANLAKLAALTVKEFVGQTQSQQGQQEPALSEQEVEQILNPVKVNADTLKLFGIEEATPEQIAGVQQFANAVVKNATSIANLVIEQRLRQTLAPYEPMVQYIKQQQSQQEINTFYSANPDLKKFEKIVATAARQVSPRKADGSMKSMQEVHSEVAAATRAILKEVGINITPAANHSAGGQQPGQQQQQRTSVPRMSQMQTPGRSQGGQPQGEPNNPDADIYLT